MRIVSGAEKPLGAAEQAGVMFSPLHAFAGPEILQCALAYVEQVLHEQRRTGQIDGTRGVRETQLLFRAERVLAVVERDVTTRRSAVGPT